MADISPGSNLVGIHVVYRVKSTDEGNLKFKARLVVHGNEDIEKDDIRKDSATAHLTAIRLILSMAVLFQLRLAKIDIKAAYFQSGPIQRRIYIRPPRELLLFTTVWKLLSLPYGIVEAGRQWQLVSDDFLSAIGLEEVYALPQCFLLRKGGRPVLLVGKIVDDFLIAGTPTSITWFCKQINQRFRVGTETHYPEPLRFNGSIIQQAKDFSVRVSMEEFASSITRLDLDRSRRKQGDEEATANETRECQSLAGKMNWLGHTAVPYYSFAASYVQQNMGNLRVRHLMQANGVVTEAKKSTPVLVYGKPKGITRLHLAVFADAAFPKVDGSTNGQTGIVCGLVFGEGVDAAFHPLAWTSHKQTRICRSSSAAEIMSIAEAAEFGSCVKLALERICEKQIPLEMNVDSRALYDTITTQHDAKEFRIRQAVKGLRESFERGDISVIRWIAGKMNPADALTKRNATTSPLLNAMMSKGRLCVAYSLGRSSQS